MENDLQAWFFQAPDWVKYRVHLDLTGFQTTDDDLSNLKITMQCDPQVQASISLLKTWQTTPLKRHNDSSHPLHHLVFLSDLGFSYQDDPILMQVVNFIIENLDEITLPTMLFNIPSGYGGTGEDQWAWMLCDAPLVLYALTQFGLGNNVKVIAARQQLINFAQENGWPCKVSSVLGKFRGPGRKSDPCPYATLLMVKLLSLNPQANEEYALHLGVDCLLSFWSERKQKKMYLFGIGSDFQKLKAPLIWFDLLHFLDIFSNIPIVKDDARLLEMNQILTGKVNSQGRYTAESVYLPWKDWEFGQKKVPSWWITFLVERIQQRIFVN